MIKQIIPFKHSLRVIKFLHGKDQRNFVLVMLGAVFLGVVEVVGVGAIMPFIAVASNPSLIDTNVYLQWAYTTFAFTSSSDFLIALGIMVLVFIILRNGFSAILMYGQLRFVHGSRHRISERLFKAYLGQEYEYFLGKNSYTFNKNLLIGVRQMMNGTIQQLVNIITNSIQITLIGLFLFIVDPLSTFLVFTLIATVYMIVFFVTRKRVSKLGKNWYDLNTHISKAVGEAFGGIKDVKISGNEKMFYDTFIEYSSQLAKNTSAENVIGVLPKYALEASGFSAIIIFIMVLITKSGDGFSSAITTISMYALAGYRLLPVLQNLFRSITALRYSQAGTETIIDELNLEETANSLSELTIEAMPFEKSIALENIVFTYKNKDTPVLNNLSFKVNANELVGFCGTTGSGKTTAIDIVLGILKPSSGFLKVDDITITKENVVSWQKNIGYVPQTIYLSDSTILENIAFGVPKDQIDVDAVKKAAHMAQIDTFIENDLPEGYDSMIGERGVRLSGGQRQRLGIARALYHNPPVLVMDEATSALDNETEVAVMSAIESLSGKKTIILIAHRTSTLIKCDCIYQIEKGQIAASGTYDQLFGSKNEGSQ